MKTAQLHGGLEIEEFTLLFKSSREFFFAPVIEYGPLAEWKEIAGAGQEMQDVFWYIKEAIDAYFADGPFSVTVKAGCLIGKKQQPMALADLEVSLDIGEDSYRDSNDTDDDDVDTGLPLPPHKIAAGSVRVADPEDLEVEEVPDDGSFEISLDVSAEQELDAFIEGKKRPSHLDPSDLDVDLE
jgi:hypothetical protein